MKACYVMSLLKMHLHIGLFQNKHKRCLVFSLEFTFLIFIILIFLMIWVQTCLNILRVLIALNQYYFHNTLAYCDIIGCSLQR